MSTTLAQPDESEGTKAAARDPERPPPIQPKFVIAGQADVTSPDAKLDDAAVAAGVGVGYESAWTVLNFFVRKGAESEIGPTSETDTKNYRSAYGASVLDPLSASYSFSISGAIYPFGWFGRSHLNPRVGFRAYATASSVRWNHLDSTKDTTSTISTQASPIGVGLCPVSVYSLSRLVNKTNSLLYGHACLALRYIGGDYALLSSGTRASILGTKNKWFPGAEMEFGVRIGALALGTRLFALTEQVGGLSNFRFIPSIAASAPLEFPLE